MALAMPRPLLVPPTRLELTLVDPRVPHESFSSARSFASERDPYEYARFGSTERRRVEPTGVGPSHGFT
jgi:hypothetical protein